MEDAARSTIPGTDIEWIPSLYRGLRAITNLLPYVFKSCLYLVFWSRGEAVAIVRSNSWVAEKARGSERNQALVVEHSGCRRT